jgi:hypothetical protein
MCTNAAAMPELRLAPCERMNHSAIRHSTRAHSAGTSSHTSHLTRATSQQSCLCHGHHRHVCRLRRHDRRPDAHWHARVSSSRTTPQQSHVCLCVLNSVSTCSLCIASVHFKRDGLLLLFIARCTKTCRSTSSRRTTRPTHTRSQTRNARWRLHEQTTDRTHHPTIFAVRAACAH